MPSSDQLTLMAVHAHPDDESLSTGGILARYSDEGIRTVVVTCTNGEYGYGPGHRNPGDPGHDPQEVSLTRMGELRSACKTLGVSHLEMLGYHDSGMADWVLKDRPDVFCNVPLEDSVSRLTRLLDQYRPDVVVTYTGLDGRNHPDHLQAHRITVEAVERTGIPAKLYFVARRRRAWETMRERMQAAGIEAPPAPAWQTDPERVRQMEDLEEQITTTVDATRWANRKRNALAVHRSQMEGSMWLRLPPVVFAEVFGTETFIRFMDQTGSPLPEEDLFEGLR